MFTRPTGCSEWPRYELWCTADRREESHANIAPVDCSLRQYSGQLRSRASSNFCDGPREGDFGVSRGVGRKVAKYCPRETTMVNNLKNRKLSYAGHIMRNTSGHYDTLLRTIEGRLEGKRGRGRPRRTWVDDLRDWTGSKRYDQIKIAAERRNLHGTFVTHSSGRNTE